MSEARPSRTIRHINVATSSVEALCRMTSSPTCSIAWQTRSANVGRSTSDRMYPLQRPARSACKRCDLFGGWTGVRLVEAFQRDVADAVEVGMVTPDQLDENGFLRLKVVVEAPREDARRVGDLL